MQFVESREGYTVVKIEERWLHSPYRPLLEARRFVTQKSSWSGCSLFIVIDIGLGFLSTAIRESYPQAKIVTIILNRECYEKSSLPPKEPHFFYEGEESSLQEFLFTHIDEIDTLSQEIVHWKPTEELFPLQNRNLYQSLLKILELLSRNLSTTRGFGSRWFSNTVKNLCLRESFYQLPFPLNFKEQERVVAIVGSGPSLRKGVDWLKRNQHQIDILALPSSQEALIKEEIIPKFVISTDAGYWAKRHFDSLLALPPEREKSWVIAPLLAALPASLERQIPFSTSNQIESILRDRLEWQTPFLAENGTVMGSAIDFCRRRYRTLILFGFDLGFDDLHSHITPSTSEGVLRRRSTSLSPLLNQFFRFKMEHDHAEGSLNVYASWFQREKITKQGEYRFAPSSVDLESFTPLTQERELDVFLKHSSPPTPQPQLILNDSISSRRQLVRSLLNEWRKRPIEEEVPHLLYFLATDSFIEAQRERDGEKRKKKMADVTEESRVILRNWESFLDE